MTTIDYQDLSEDQQTFIDENTNETLPQGITWFIDSETGNLYWVENNLLDLHSQQSPNDIKVI